MAAIRPRWPRARAHEGLARLAFLAPDTLQFRARVGAGGRVVLGAGKGEKGKRIPR